MNVGSGRLVLFVTCAVAITCASAALASPQGGTVIDGGPVSVTQDGTHTQIETTTEQTRMRWDGFDIAVDESVHVQQPNSGSTLVNHIPDAGITTIDGSLTSNGRVWILNPAGVYFGGSAIVEVAGLVAAAGSITDQAYVIGARHFTGLQGEVINNGSIHAGSDGVALLGRVVENHGQIVTDGGEIVMAAGDEVRLMRHDTFIQVHMGGLVNDAGGSDAGRPSVLNTGTLDAGTGRARLAAGDFLGLAIRNQGTIHARTIEIEAGSESIVEISGNLDARNHDVGGGGGHIEVTGDYVVVDDATLDASGEAGGGEVWLGGEAAGQEAELRNARGVFVSDDSEIRADALASGDGGEVIVWGDEIAQVQGTLSARGGLVAGDGGFIETSSKGRLLVTADIDVSAANGARGTWLLDPVNVRILRQDKIDLLPMPTQFSAEFDPDLGFTVAQPEGAAADSVVSTQSIVDALIRGGTVVVTTEVAEGGAPGTDVGNIVLVDEIRIPDGSEVAPNSTAELSLIATNDITLGAEIASDDPDLMLNVSLFANDNALLSGSLGQAEPQDQLRLGDVIINQDITTNGGSVQARGTNVVVNAAIRTARINPDDGVGGLVSLSAVDPVEIGRLAGSSDDAFGNVTLTANASIVTDGGAFLSSGQKFTQEFGFGPLVGVVDVFRELMDDPDVAGTGSVLIDHSKEVMILGEMEAEAISIGSGSAGVAMDENIVIGEMAVLRATEIDFNAGDGAGGASTSAIIDIRVPAMGAPGAMFTGPGPMMGGHPLERFQLSQDAPINFANLPVGAQFPNGIVDTIYLLETRDGDPDPIVPDIHLDNGSASGRFTDADLILSAPDSIRIDGPTGARNLSLLIEEGFVVDTTLANALTLADPPDPDEGDGLLVIHAARRGTGDLELADAVDLTAPMIALRAGDLLIGPGSGTTSSVIIPDNANFDTDSFEVRQDADLSSETLPTAGQFSQFAGMEYALISDSGSVTIRLGDAAKVIDTKLTIAAIQDIDDDIVLEEVIRVESGDFGGLGDFEVREDLLDKFAFKDSIGRTLTLRAAQGLLSFAANSENTAPEGDDPIFEPLRIEADRIRLIGSTINTTTNTPYFIASENMVDGEFTAPKSFIFQHGAQVTDTVLPTADNFPGGAPEDLFAIQSLTEIRLVHRSDPGARGWQFPILPDTNVVLSAPAVFVERTDGGDLVLDGRDNIWGDSITFTAALGPGQPAVIIDPKVDADDLNSVLGFDDTIDFTFDPANLDMELPENSVDNFAVDQDGSFLLRDIGNDGLPDLDPSGSNHPDFVALTSRKGSIQVENDLFGPDLALQLVLEADDQFIDLERGPVPLSVRSLVVQLPGRFTVGQDMSGMVPSDFATVFATDSITLTSGASQAGLLDFAPMVELQTKQLRLQAGSGTTSVVDALTNDPTFVVEEFSLVQTGPIQTGHPTLAARLPGASQFQDPGGLERYFLQSGADIELNDPINDILFARDVEIRAGSQNNPRILTLRADGADPNLELIGSATAEGVFLVAGQIFLEAPQGFVDAGDPRVEFNILLGSQPSLAVRQLNPIVLADATKLPENRQLLGAANAPYLIQSVNGIELGAKLADRLTENNLILVAGVPQESFDLALGSSRYGDPDPGFPDAVYDRFADLEDMGASSNRVDAADQAALDLLMPSIVIDDPMPDPNDPTVETFDLILASLQIRSDPGNDADIMLGSVHIQTESDQTYADEVTLTGKTRLTARAGTLEELSPVVTPTAASITFEQTVNGQDDGDDSLIIDATDRVHFKGQIGTNVRLGHLEINLEQLLQFQNPPPVPRIEFGTVDTPGDFLVRADEILLNSQANGQFVRAQVPDRPTVFRRGGNLSFVLGDATTNTPGTFLMGQNEKLTVDGANLTIDANGGTVTVGDLSALDLIDVKAGTIQIRRREKGHVTRANGEILRDNGVDFVARNIHFEFDGSTTSRAGEILHRNQVGSGKDARFGIADPANAPAFMSDFSVLALQFNILAGAGNLPLDGVPDGLSRVELGRVFADLRPEVPIAVPASHRIGNLDSLDTLGVRLREPTDRELRDAARGAAIYQDLGSLQSGDDIRVSESRLVAEEVDETARLYREVFGEDGSHVPGVRNALQGAIDDYKRSTGARRVVGLELRRYVYNRPSSQFEAYQQLQSLDALFRHHRRSGLTRSEYGIIQNRWLEAIAPEGIEMDELAEFIHPSRYVRGRDVLDVFTD